MRLLRIGPVGAERPAVLVDDELLDVSGHVTDYDRMFFATGGLAANSPLFVRTIADVLGQPVEVHPSAQGPARGAAILGVLAAGRASGLGSVPSAVRAMGAPPGQAPAVVSPDRTTKATYRRVYAEYRRLAEQFSNPARSDP